MTFLAGLPMQLWLISSSAWQYIFISLISTHHQGPHVQRVRTHKKKSGGHSFSQQRSDVSRAKWRKCTEILFPVTCTERVRPQFLSRLHSIITSRWLKLVTCCFLLVKQQFKIFLISSWSSLCANVNNPVLKVWNVLISLTFSPAHICTSYP